METLLLLPDGQRMMPEIFGEGGTFERGKTFGPLHVNYGKEVIRKGERMVVCTGSSQSTETNSEPDFLYIDGNAVALNLYVPEGFASVLTVKPRNFYLAIWSMDDPPICVAVFKIKYDEPSSQTSTEYLRSRLTYNVTQDEGRSRDDEKKGQMATHKVAPGQEKIALVSYPTGGHIDGHTQDTWHGNIFNRAEGCYVFVHNDKTQIFEICLSQEMVADLEIEKNPKEELQRDMANAGTTFRWQ
ncbi:hypothetical protein Forpe1208_v015861 [Fusarium oxysporum f. sp. rapae]|uniref:Uncharacterized protein n=1 Tax=Fusarium oxysporum f. sp. rapae TaxID=485398 RepID=A0A8J5NL05_FUSOX|nr:hypothetical protein Forpe1208_v015861 [Fusarium oxysporum f. sp. rapae]